MLKTNSKKARENIRAYIIENFDPTGYDVNQNPKTFKEIASIIIETFRAEKPYSNDFILYYGFPEISVFLEWCSGLPSILDTCYFYNRSAVADLGKILEETSEEMNRFDESEAETLLTRLIYREIIKEATK